MTEQTVTVPHALDQTKAIQRVKMAKGWDIQVITVRKVKQTGRDATYEVIYR